MLHCPVMSTENLQYQHKHLWAAECPKPTSSNVRIGVWEQPNVVKNAESVACCLHTGQTHCSKLVKHKSPHLIEADADPAADLVILKCSLAGTARAVCACKHCRLVWVQALRLPATCTGGYFLTNKCRRCYWLRIEALFRSTLAGTARAVCACKHRRFVWVQALRLPAARSCCTACCAFSRCLGLTYFFAQETNTFFPHKAMSKMQSRVPGPPQNP